MKPESLYKRTMKAYYLKLLNTWKVKTRKAALEAIQMLSDMDKNLKDDDTAVEKVLNIIGDTLGDEFAQDCGKADKKNTETMYKLGLSDAKTDVGFGIRFDYVDRAKRDIISRQNVFWLRDHYNSQVRGTFQKILTDAIEQGFTKKKLAAQLQAGFKNTLKGSKSYFQGLAEHTSLRIRQFGRLNGYKKAGIEEFEIVAILDSRTSNICKALHGKRIKVAKAMETIEKILDIDIETLTPEDAKAELKEIAPFASDKDVEFDKEGNPVGLKGKHSPFPPYHWRCRTRTRAVKIRSAA